MRNLVLVASVLLAVPSFARNRSHAKPKADVSAQVAAVDDEPVHEVAAEKGLDTGKLREVSIAAPVMHEMVSPHEAMIDKGPQSDDPAAARAQSDEPVSGVKIEELASRQMRKYDRSINGCINQVRKKTPAATGSLDLVIDVTDHKVTNVKVTDDSLNNGALNACLVKSARSWSFSLPDAQFTKTVVLSPQASR